MKLILIDYKNHNSEVKVMDGYQLMYCFVFDDHKQARAFCSGFTCARNVANVAIRSLPMIYETKKVPA